VCRLMHTVRTNEQINQPRAGTSEVRRATAMITSLRTSSTSSHQKYLRVEVNEAAKRLTLA
jgi:hypothetical protein